ncbi:3-hexulose-6-phosphate synthase [Aequitasia blattaphilus]|uniref:3-hexulose-6-phosphate synthase n=1 Tax=Aequitasia blattaphilus TaxID=2949332 RepID=A0ABT1EA47_9FIRM|nr:3-hexulose-6-phosphate synthase [Aequitasia blattaphilus]MCP1102698.1 3-hexulose-6-phosphate synthase [Aequitasia blattaphilus]MCR8615338.1 3-hexulose-6-phosphate synthase [Aequitasia blattaphilus]
MKLQLAIDDLSMEEALKLTDSILEYIDIIEMGSPFLMEYGMEAVRSFKNRYPEKEILADLKIMDAGFFEAELAFRAGADYATVLGVTDLLTIQGCQDAAEQYGRKIYVDMICVPDIPTRMKAIEEIGVFGISVHTGVDQQAAGRSAIDDLKLMLEHRQKAEISVAGGIHSGTIQSYIDAGADVVISGGGICHSENPRLEAAKIAKCIAERTK